MAWMDWWVQGQSVTLRRTTTTTNRTNGGNLKPCEGGIKLKRRPIKGKCFELYSIFIRSAASATLLLFLLLLLLLLMGRYVAMELLSFFFVVFVVLRSHQLGESINKWSSSSTGGTLCTFLRTHNQLVSLFVRLQTTIIPRSSSSLSFIQPASHPPVRATTKAASGEREERGKKHESFVFWLGVCLRVISGMARNERRQENSRQKQQQQPE